MRKYSFLFLIVLLFSSNLFSQKYDGIKNLTQKISGSKILSSGTWGVYAKYTDTNEEIISFNGNKSLAPASGLKVVTSSAGLNILGENYRFKTRIYYNGRINNGELNGDIYIIGGGDPTLGSDLVDNSPPLNALMRRWKNSIEKLGIKKINGKIIGDDHLFEGNSVPDYWPFIDIGNYYGAGVSALTINDNLYYLYFKPGINVGDEAKVLRTVPVIPGLKFINYMKTGKEGSGDNGYIYSAPYQYNAVLRGTIPAGVEDFSIKGSIPNPALFAAQHFTSYLESHNIQITEDAGVSHTAKDLSLFTLIDETLSPPLKDIVYIVNKRSNNLYTEQILMALSFEKYGVGSREKSLQIVYDFLVDNNINIDGLELYDGSGLSRTDMVTPKIMVDLLSAMTTKKSFLSFYNSLGIAGDKNDISFYKNFGTGTSMENNARIKSGLITGVRSHSGYVKDRSGRTIAFSLIANNFNGSVSEINNFHESVIEALAELK